MRMARATNATASAPATRPTNKGLTSVRSCHTRNDVTRPMPNVSISRAWLPLKRRRGKNREQIHAPTSVAVCDPICPVTGADGIADRHAGWGVYLLTILSTSTLQRQPSAGNADVWHRSGHIIAGVATADTGQSFVGRASCWG